MDTQRKDREGAREALTAVRRYDTEETPEPWECPQCHCLFERAGMDHEPCRAQQGEVR